MQQYIYQLCRNDQDDDQTVYGWFLTREAADDAMRELLSLIQAKCPDSKAIKVEESSDPRSEIVAAYDIVSRRWGMTYMIRAFPVGRNGFASSLDADEWFFRQLNGEEPMGWSL